MNIKISKDMMADIKDWGEENGMTLDEAIEYLFQLGLFIQKHKLEEEVEELNEQMNKWRKSIGE